MTVGDDPGRALHEALSAWVRSPGRSWAVDQVVAATAQVPALRAAGESIARTGGAADDWRAVAAADPHASWPHVDALARAAVTKVELLMTGQMNRRLDGPHGVAFDLEGARVTWREGCLAVGAPPATSGGDYRLVDDLGAGSAGAALSWPEMPAPSREPGAVGVIVHRHLVNNYYHWLLVALRAAILLDDSGQLAGLRRLIVCMPSPVPRFIRQSLDAVGLAGDRIEVRTTPFDCSFDTLLVTTPYQVFRALPVGDYAGRLRERLGQAGTSRGERRRLLISRGDAECRRVVNEGELASALRDHGFEVIRPGELTFAEQVGLFASAELIVAPHGAALANLLFCSPGTGVVEHRNERLDRPFFERLARALGLRYAAVPSPADAAFPEDFRVDVAATTSVVESLLEPR